MARFPVKGDGGDCGPDLYLERVRRQEVLPAPGQAAGPGSPALLGRVTTASPAAGKFVLVNPVTVTGAEVEGGAGTLTVDTSVSVPVYIVGPGAPQTGDDLVCSHVAYRWCAYRKTPPGAGTWNVTVKGCASANLSGRTVTLTETGATAVTDGSGVASFTGLAAGTYHATVSPPTGYDSGSATTVLAAGATNNTTVTLTAAAGYSCTCSPCCEGTTLCASAPYVSPTWPSSIFVNDGFGTATLNNSVGDPTVYTATVTRSASATIQPADIGGFFVCNSAPGASVPVLISVFCDGGGGWRVQFQIGTCSHDPDVPPTNTAFDTGQMYPGLDDPATGAISYVFPDPSAGAPGVDATACPPALAGSFTVTAPANIGALAHPLKKIYGFPLTVTYSQ